jgi:hypothetical protein
MYWAELNEMFPPDVFVQWVVSCAHPIIQLVLTMKDIPKDCSQSACESRGGVTIRLEDLGATADIADAATEFLTEMEDADDTQELLDVIGALPIALENGSISDFLRSAAI